MKSQNIQDDVAEFAEILKLTADAAALALEQDESKEEGQAWEERLL